eukprot:sb/3469130/
MVIDPRFPALITIPIPFPISLKLLKEPASHNPNSNTMSFPQLSFGEPRAKKTARPDTPAKPKTCLYGDNITQYSNKNQHRVTCRSSDNLGLVRIVPTGRSNVRTPAGREGDELMRGVRDEARRSLRQMEGSVIGPRKTPEQGGSWTGLRRENHRELKNRKADQILDKNISKWHKNFLNKTPTLPESHGNLQLLPQRSQSCDLPSIPCDRLSVSSRKSDPRGYSDPRAKRTAFPSVNVI